MVWSVRDRFGTLRSDNRANSPSDLGREFLIISSSSMFLSVSTLANDFNDDTQTRGSSGDVLPPRAISIMRFFT